jgi:Arylsulfotransferase (ASST)
VLDCGIVEIDLRTGERRFEWHAVDHIAVEETVLDGPPANGGTYDYLHANSIHLDDDGTLLVSARNSSAVYKVDRTTGQILWRLGGKRSDFRMGDGTAFGWQHDVRRQADGTITMFDDQQPPDRARGLVLALDEIAMTATLVRSFERPEGLEVSSQGNMQVLPNGNVLVGWGSQPVLTEFGPDGSVVFDASLPAGKQSYRDVRGVWAGRPTDRPALAIDPVVEVTSSQHRVNAYASWNGATEVRAWQLLTGATVDALKPVAVSPRTGFETVITEVVDAKASAFIAVTAIDGGGNPLGTSKPVATG